MLDSSVQVLYHLAYQFIRFQLLIISFTLEIAMSFCTSQVQWIPSKLEQSFQICGKWN